MTLDFLSQIIQDSIQWNNILKVIKEKNVNLEHDIQEKYLSQMKKKEFFRQKLREPITSRPTLHKTLKEVLWTEEIWYQNRKLELYREIKSTGSGIMKVKKKLFSLPWIALNLNDYLK